MENNYRVEILSASKELSTRERIQLKDTSECVSLDKFSQEPFAKDAEIPVKGYAILSIHNEKAKGDTDYEQLVIISDEQNFITGSNSFRTSFMDIYSEMENETEPWSIRVIRKESKNYSGEFLKAVLV